MRSTIDRPSPRPRATLAPWSRRWNSWNTSFCFEAGMPRPVSQTCEADAIAAPARPDEHAARRRVLDRVRDQVLQQPAQQAPVGADGERRRDEGDGRARARRRSARTRAAAGGTSRRCGSSSIAASWRRCRGARCRAARSGSPRPRRARRRRSRRAPNRRRRGRARRARWRRGAPRSAAAGCRGSPRRGSGSSRCWPRRPRPWRASAPR